MSNGTAFARPEPPHAPEPGLRWEAVPADPRVWSPVPPPEEGTAAKTCRWRGSGEQHACGRVAVLRRMRGIQRRVPWHYCDNPLHSDGRWIEDVDGKPAVMEWRQVDDPDWDGPS